MNLRKERLQAVIPTCSMADIAFLLLIFFMVTTVFRAETGLKVIIPLAESAEKIPTKNLTHVWLAKDGMLSIDDALVSMDKITPIMSGKKQINPDIIVSVRCDAAANYKLVENVFDRFVNASVLKISLATDKKRG
ncbi:MAG: biopolymer transporter ExbD [candidate division WOR-3 bacterium]|nr:biopolymer transporter ExbD [candidate division WOR-3 bacterium]